jgi:hypothetical protein
MKVEEEYTDILQNIEFVIVEEYRKDRTVLDRDARDAVQALVRRYEAELESQGPPNAPLSSRARNIYGAAEAVCEWILGRPAPSLRLPPEKPRVSTSVLVACLKRIRKSIDYWNKRDGRQGYFNYVIDYIR